MADTSGGGTTALKDREALSVAKLNEHISVTIDAATYLEDVVCRGEVSGLYKTDRSAGFTLSDADGTHELNCYLFRSEYRRLNVDLDDGVEVVVNGDIEYWVKGGDLQLRPTDIALVGEGAVQARIDRLRADLNERGWFDSAHKRQIPRHPECVGVVTSRDGDARHDIQNEIHSCHPGVDIVLHHAGVQGDGAPGELAEAIDTLDRMTDIDVVIAGRGGGSDRSLMTFDNETVAEAIFHAETPVVSAVGHREDNTIACDVADVAVSTPTAAGSLFQERDATLEAIDEYGSNIEAAYTALVADRVDHLERRLDQAYRQHEYDAAVEDAERTVPLVYKVAVLALIVLVIALFIITVL